MTNSLLQEAAAIEPDLIALRREIHRHPELGRHEQATAALVERVLKSLDIEVRRAAQTGVMGILRGDLPGRCVALRADMDALPIQEQTGLPFASENPGVMHACGHDMHTASLLGAAKILSDHRSQIHGEVRFLFQPDEEGDGGAQRMIDDGCMQGVDAVFGAHVAPEHPSGSVGMHSGAFYAASNPFDILIRGQSSHGAEPHKGRDAIVAASAIVGQLQTLVTRILDPLSPAVVSIGAFHAGTARNVIADEARLSGIIRCYGRETRELLAAQITQLAQNVAAAYGTQAEVSIQWGYSGVTNDEAMTNHAEACAVRLLGKHAVRTSPMSLTSEDFGAYQEKAPGCFWHLGVGRPGEKNAPLHSACFNPDESAMKIAAAMHAQIVLSFLE